MLCGLMRLYGLCCRCLLLRCLGVSCVVCFCYAGCSLRLLLICFGRVLVAVVILWCG